MAASSSSSAAPPATTRKHYSGLWIGESRPDASLTDVPVNPIKWTMTLMGEGAGGGGAVSAFGAGYFDDSGDIPGMEVVFYTLRGSFSEDSGKVSLLKEYSSRLIPEELSVKYEGVMSLGEDGQPVIAGQWANAMEGTFGVFGCRLEES